MNDNTLTRLFEHNNWANTLTLHACLALSDQQLDAEPLTGAYGTIRDTLTHLIRAQSGYLSLLTIPFEQRTRPATTFDELPDLLATSGKQLLALAAGASDKGLPAPLRTLDDHHVEPWVVLLQVINHATEHREQINSMLTALGVTPPELDGWAYGASVKALRPR